jgi:CheY-like chemotaxis protein
MDGFELACAIGLRPASRPTPIVLLTSRGQSGDASRCRDLGVTALLTKPVRRADLRAVVENALAGTTNANPRPTAARPSRTPALRILVAEDNVVNQQVAKRLLERCGHTVLVAWDGKEALDILEQQRVDIVLMDAQMPKMDGFEATAAIRAKEKVTGGHQIIIATTACAMKGDEERCLAAGMDAYVSKPISLQALTDAINESYAISDREQRDPVVRV